MGQILSHSECAVRVAGDTPRPCDRGCGCHLKCFVYGTLPIFAQLCRESSLRLNSPRGSNRHFLSVCPLTISYSVSCFSYKALRSAADWNGDSENYRRLTEL
jgi:hypothetical protein